jgi:hypothetical protein
LKNKKPNYGTLVVVSIFLIIISSCNDQKAPTKTSQIAAERNCSIDGLSPEEIANCQAPAVFCETHAIGKDWSASCDQDDKTSCVRDESYQYPSKIVFQKEQVSGVLFTVGFGEKIEENKYKFVDSKTSYQIVSFYKSGYRLAAFDSERKDGCSDNQDTLCIYMECTLKDKYEFLNITSTQYVGEGDDVQAIIENLGK